MRIRRFSGIVILAAGFGLVAGAPGARAAGPDTAPPLVTNLKAVTDAVGDAVDTATSAVVDNARADITSASLEYAPGWIRMKVQLKTPTDPLKDPAWSDKSDAEWAIDTNNDGQEDYTVEFATDKGELYGAVFDATKPDTKSKCDADSASYSPQDGYTLVIDPACIGNPKSVGYAVAMFFDTDPKDDKNPMATDRVPDSGFISVAAPGQPEPGPAVAPAGAPGTPGPAGAAPVRPRVAAGAPGAAPKSAAAAKPGAAGSAPNRAAASTPGTTPAGAPAPAAGSSAPGATSVGSGAPDNLARTGRASQRAALFGVGLMLLGAGVVVMTRPARRLARPLGV